MGDAYPQLVAAPRRDRARGRTRRRCASGARSTRAWASSTRRCAAPATPGTELPAEVAFELHDTYGFPFDLTREIAAESEMTVDEERFERLMEEQRERARAAQKAGAFGAGPGELEDFQRAHADIAVDFVGYERLEVFTVDPRLRRSSPTAAWPSSSPSRRSTPRAAARSPTRAGSTPSPASSRSRTSCASRTTRSSWRGSIEGEVVRGRARQGDGQRRAPPPDGLQPHGHAPAAQRPAHRARRARAAGRLAGAARAAALRLLGARRRRRPEQLRQIEDLVNRRIVENHPVRPFVTTREYAAEIGALGLLRGEVRRVRARARDRRLQPRALRRHARLVDLADRPASRSPPASRSAPTRGASRRSPRPRPSSTTASSSRRGTAWPPSSACSRTASPATVDEAAAERVHELEKKLKAAESGERRDVARRAARRRRARSAASPVVAGGAAGGARPTTS